MSNITTLSDQTTAYIISGSKWARFLAILGFISSGLIFIGMIALFFAAGTSSDVLGIPFLESSVILILLYGLIFLFQFLSSLYLYRFSDKLSTSVKNSDNVLFEESFSNYKKLFMLIGVFMITMISIYFIVFAFSFYMMGL